LPGGLSRENSNVVVELHSVINHDLIQRRGTKHDNAEPSTNGSQKRKISLDWTRHDIPNASPYITFLRTFDWAATPLGPMKDWSTSLRLQFMSIVAHPHHRALIWGEEETFIYNEGATALFGAYHPVRLHFFFTLLDFTLPNTSAAFNGEACFCVCRLLRPRCSFDTLGKRGRKVQFGDELGNQYGSVRCPTR